LVEMAPTHTAAGSGKAIHHRRDTCRACGGRNLRRFLSLGPTPLANAFLRSPDEFAGEAHYPLDVYFCVTCSLVQLLDVIDPEVLFRDYIYVTGTSDTMAAHNTAYATALADLLRLTAGDLVVEAGSNDGSLLACFRGHGVRTLGVEPAGNIAALARERGIETLNLFFDTQAAQQIRASHGPAKAVLANNVLAHVDEPVSFLRGCRTLLAAGGLVVIEAPYLGELLARLEYDTIYHEHLSYFSITALVHLFQEAGLAIVRIDRVPVHGGSLRVYGAAWEEQGGHAGDVRAAAAMEQDAGLAAFARYQRFADEIAQHRRELCALLEALDAEGKTIAGYGAPAKGNTLLNYCGIGTNLLPYTVDKSPLKVGRWTPGMHLPVLPVATLMDRKPDYVLVLAWNFADEIMRQQQAYRDGGGRFIIPLPEPKVV
jgi:SAM-dependent methyltransferase